MMVLVPLLPEKSNYNHPWDFHLTKLSKIRNYFLPKSFRVSKEQSEAFGQDKSVKENIKENKSTAIMTNKKPPLEATTTNDFSLETMILNDSSLMTREVCKNEKWWSDKRRPRFILYWNEAYGSTKYGFCCNRQPFIEHG